MGLDSGAFSSNLSPNKGMDADDVGFAPTQVVDVGAGISVADALREAARGSSGAVAGACRGGAEQAQRMCAIEESRRKAGAKQARSRRKAET